jgi:protein SCO1
MPKLIFAVVSVLAILMTATMWMTTARPQNKASGTASVGGAFELTDQDGRSVTEHDLIGKPTVIFFGFTYCPDICPTTLLEMSNWMKELGSDADKLNVVFVSVDSERDTPSQLKLYLSSFDPRIRGFTGTEAQIKTITKAYRVYYKRVPLDKGDYTYDHSSVIYLMDAANKYVGLLNYKTESKEAVGALRQLASASR